MLAMVFSLAYASNVARFIAVLAAK